MSKKKSPPKKHKFKHVERAESSLQPGQTESLSVSPATITRSQLVSASTRDFSYVGADIRRIALMALALVAIELLFYYLLVFTSVGDAIYRMVTV